MKRTEQTDKVKEKLYNLTLSFIKKHQSHYYIQFKGEPEDLALEFFCEFLTPKSRIKGNEQSLLDKYDVSKKPANMSEEAFFANLVKVSTIRMLIDRSRADNVNVKSIDNYIDSFGDVVSKVFNLTTEQPNIEEFMFSPSYIETVKSKFNSLSRKSQISLQKKYMEVCNVIDPLYRELFDKVIIVSKKEPENVFIEVFDNEMKNCLCQQITAKTVCLLVDDKVVDFDRFSGACRNKALQHMKLSAKALSEIKDVTIYKSKYSRKDIIESEFVRISNNRFLRLV